VSQLLLSYTLAGPTTPMHNSTKRRKTRTMTTTMRTPLTNVHACYPSVSSHAHVRLPYCATGGFGKRAGFRSSWKSAALGKRVHTCFNRCYCGNNNNDFLFQRMVQLVCEHFFCICLVEVCDRQDDFLSAASASAY
jgi:hypothetical protein